MSIKTGGVGDNPAIDKMMNATSASIGTYAATVMAAKIIKGKKGETGKRWSAEVVPKVQPKVLSVEKIKKELVRELAKNEALERHQVEEGKEEEFFKGFENIEEEYLVEGALLTCTGIEPKDVYIIVGDGTEKQKYEGKPDRKNTPLSKISGTPKNGENCYAKISDAIGHVNIQPFGNCKYSNIKLNEPKIMGKKNDCETYGTCYALMELNKKWENMAGGSKYNKNNKFEDCINMLSQLACFQGGIIFPVDTGQEMGEGSGSVYAIAESTSSSAFYNYMTRDKQEANALYIYYYLSNPNNGWEKEAIAGLLGNLQQECVMNPGAWQSMGKSGDGNVNQGYGLLQWTAATDKFLEDAGLSNTQANNLATNDPKALMDMQLEYLLTTMKQDGGEWYSSEVLVKDHYNAYPLDSSTPRLMSYSDYISSTIDAGELALVFQAHYERSGDYKVEQTEHRLQDRHDCAQDWYTFLKNY